MGQRTTDAVLAAMDGQDLWADLRTLAEYGKRSDGGVARLALDEDDVRARIWLIEQGKRYGCTAGVDVAANVFLRRPGSQTDLAPVVVGSHLDSQPAGGAYDGALGVLAGLQLLKALHRQGVHTRRSIEVVSWTNEEGVRFAPGTSGSACFSGVRTVNATHALLDEAGVLFGACVDDCLAHLKERHVERVDIGRPFHAFLEAHIEQGPVLERGHNSAGVVTGIQGVSWYRITVHGIAGHAGTTPRAARADAVEGACMLSSHLREVCRDPDDQVRFTVGRFQVQPDSVNTIPDQVTFTVDLRHPEAAMLDNLHAQFEALCAQVWASCEVSLESLSRINPVHFPDDIVQRMETIAGELRLDAPRLVSGAFHDAIHLAGHCPTGMVFIPCEDGISHHPNESITRQDAFAGARLLAATALDLASE